MNGYDTWSETIKVASQSDCPLVVTSYTEFESPRDLDRFKHETANHAKQMDLIYGPSLNQYASQRPERNFISDELVPLIFKNYFCFVLKWIVQLKKKEDTNQLLTADRTIASKNKYSYTQKWYHTNIIWKQKTGFH